MELVDPFTGKIIKPLSERYIKLLQLYEFCKRNKSYHSLYHNQCELLQVHSTNQKKKTNYLLITIIIAILILISYNKRSTIKKLVNNYSIIKKAYPYIKTLNKNIDLSVPYKVLVNNINSFFVKQSKNKTPIPGSFPEPKEPQEPKETNMNNNLLVNITNKLKFLSLFGNNNEIKRVSNELYKSLSNDKFYTPPEY